MQFDTESCNASHIAIDICDNLQHKHYIVTLEVCFMVWTNNIAQYSLAIGLCYALHVLGKSLCNSAET